MPLHRTRPPAPKGLQQVDLRGRNSWRLQLHDVPAVARLETQRVNAVAPFILNARLEGRMLGTRKRDRHIVNVSAMAGQFHRNFKTVEHRTPIWPGRC